VEPGASEAPPLPLQLVAATATARNACPTPTNQHLAQHNWVFILQSQPHRGNGQVQFIVKTSSPFQFRWHVESREAARDITPAYDIRCFDLAVYAMVALARMPVGAAI
jgi:hypothetical protein